jgi:glycosyltransferase involved in cell wall biosynthesis
MQENQKIECDVCIVTSIHGDFDNRIYQRQANALLDAGFHVHIVAPWNFSNRSRTDFTYSALAFPTTRFKRIAHGYRVFKAAKAVPSKIFIFHDNDFLLWAYLLKLATGKIVIYDAHENIPEDILYAKAWIPRILRPAISFAFRRVEEFIVQRLGHTIVAVESLRRRFAALGARAELVRNFANFQVSPDFRNAPAILYTGDLSRDYGFENILSLARKLKERRVKWPLLIVDRFRMEVDLRKIFISAMKEEGLNVELLNSVPAEHMPDILCKGRIGLSPIPDLPNKALALPTKIFEYFAFGLVALASDISGTRDILADRELGFLLPPDDMDPWVDKIEWLIENPDVIQEYQRRGRKASRETYNWTKERDTLVNYVKELLSLS